jgi:predicted nucleotidyltransferase
LLRLRRYATEQLGVRREVREVVLFGSLAREDWSARSDADVAVIVDGAPDRAAGYLPSEPIGVPVDVFVYTPAEAAAWSERFSAEIAGGIVLYSRPR